MKNIYDLDHMIPTPFNLLPKTAVKPVEVRKGDHLFRDGDRTFGLFVAYDTTVHLARVSEDGETIMIHRATPGTWFAEASLFSETYHCDAVAQQNGSVLSIDKAAVLKGLHEHNFAKDFCKTLSVQVQQTRQMREILAIRSAKDRVYAGLVAGLLVGTVMDFAATVSLTHEATYRALRELVTEGRVQNSQRGTYQLHHV